MKMKFCDDDEYCGLEKHELENPDVLRDEWHILLACEVNFPRRLTILNQPYWATWSFLQNVYQSSGHMFWSAEGKESDILVANLQFRFTQFS
jgi:hypothetical protein